MNKKIIFALLGVFLMTSGIFVLISYVPTPSSTSSGNGTAIPALNSVGETGGTSIGVNYWTQSSVANSGTTTVDMSIEIYGISNFLSEKSKTVHIVQFFFFDI